MALESPLFGGVEGGGTKFVCIAGSGPDAIEDHARFDTTTPDETLGRVVAFFARLGPRLKSVGIGSFGPVDLHPGSLTWGFITSTPKPGWQQTDVARRIASSLGIPVAFETDVNTAALGEAIWGAARGVRDCLYLTIGTGIGGGALVNGRPLHGLVHPEMGHVAVPRAPGDDFPGACPFHGDCLEGMIAGPALRARTGRPGESLPDDDRLWEFVAHYLAHAITTFIYTLSPERIVVGGGISRRSRLFPDVRARVSALLNGYVRAPEILEQIDAYIVPPALGDRSGALGALALAAGIAPGGIDR